MRLVFEGSGQYVKLVINRDEKKLQVATSKTNYQLTDASWSYLFDKGQEKIQEKITDKLNDEQFILAITLTMEQNGYRLKKRG